MSDTVNNPLILIDPTGLYHTFIEGGGSERPSYKGKGGNGIDQVP